MTLYVSLALSNQISILAADGTELSAIQSAPTDAIPLDNPAGLAFDNRTKSLLIANHVLLSGNPAHFAVLKTLAGDAGDPLEQPFLTEIRITGDTGSKIEKWERPSGRSHFLHRLPLTHRQGM